MAKTYKTALFMTKREQDLLRLAFWLRFRRSRLHPDNWPWQMSLILPILFVIALIAAKVIIG